MMARIRTIKPEFFRHEELFDAEQETGFPLRLAFAGLWTVCDREGRFRWCPRQIKLDVLPHDNVDFSRVLDALTTRGFIVKYTINGEAFGYVPSWGRHQVINNRESVSELPEPPPSSGGVGVVLPRTEPPETTREPRVTDACPTPLVHAQGEGEGEGEEEGKGRGRESTSSLRSEVGPRKCATPRPSKTAIPDDFGISDRVRRWAGENGFGRLDDHLAAFRRKCAAHGYAYLDHDAAFMEAIREDWAKLRRGPSAGAPPPDDTGGKAADDSARYLAEQAEHRRHATKPPATLLAIAGKAGRAAQ